MEILKVEDLSFTYPGDDNKVLDNVSFSLEKGEFVLLCGATGSGKSTLIRLLKKEIAPEGRLEGKISVCQREREEISADRMGLVAQNIEEQIVTDKVGSELAFGLSAMGLDKENTERRIAEISTYFGIQEKYDDKTAELSGGQKQLLSLASVMAMDPEILLLDEPTAQLDPIAASEFISTLKKINRELSVTVVIVEHRLEEIFPVCDRVLVMENGRIIANGPPREVGAGLCEKEDVLMTMPSPIRLYHALGRKGRCPLGVRETREYVSALVKGDAVPSVNVKTIEPDIKKRKKALEFKDVFFRYERNLHDILCGLDLTVYEGEIFCILGGNGTGKTTAMMCAAGVRRPYSGSIRVFDKKISDHRGESLYKGCLALLPQDVQTLFLRGTVREELEDAGVDLDTLPYDLSPHLEKHPYDLSGGEQQLLALAKVLATGARLLIADEPTKGLDSTKKLALARLFDTLRKEGRTVVIVTHDVEFAAMCADRCALFFRGRALSVQTSRDFFSGNSFYTTSVARITRGIINRAMTVEDVVSVVCKDGELP